MLRMLSEYSKRRPRVRSPLEPEGKNVEGLVGDASGYLRPTWRDNLLSPEIASPRVLPRF